MMFRSYTVGIIVFDGVLTAEVTGPAEVFGSASKRAWFENLQVRLIGVTPQPVITTEEGLRLMVDATIADDVALDVLLVPGGNEMDALLQHAELNAFIQKQATGTQWLGSVCAGAFLLGQAGVLNGKQATTWFGGEASLQAQFPAIQVKHDQPIVLDQRRITANGGVVSYEAALVLLGQLSSATHAKEIYLGLGFQRLSAWPKIAALIGEADKLHVP